MNVEVPPGGSLIGIDGIGVSAKAAEVVASKATDMIVSGWSPEFVSVKLCAGAVTPTRTPPKSSDSGATWSCGATPMPVSGMLADGNVGSSVVSESVAVELAIAIGAKLSWRTAELPPGTENGAFRLAAKRAASGPVIASVFTLNGPVPLLAMVSEAVPIVPTITIPKSTDGGITDAIGTVPTPLTESLRTGTFGSSLAICTCALRAPAVVGVKVTANVAVPPTGIVTGVASGV